MRLPAVVLSLPVLVLPLSALGSSLSAVNYEFVGARFSVCWRASCVRQRFVLKLPALIVRWSEVRLEFAGVHLAVVGAHPEVVGAHSPRGRIMKYPRLRSSPATPTSGAKIDVSVIPSAPVFVPKP